MQQSPPVLGLKRNAVLCLLTHRGDDLMLHRAREPNRGLWVPVGGKLDPFESPRAAAIRELREETGISDATLVEGFSRQIVYHFRSSRKGLVRKEVIFFVARVSGEAVRLSEEHVGYAWLEREAALAQLSFDNARTVLSAAADFLDQHDPPT